MAIAKMKLITISAEKEHLLDVLQKFYYFLILYLTQKHHLFFLLLVLLYYEVYLLKMLIYHFLHQNTFSMLQIYPLLHL